MKFKWFVIMRPVLLWNICKLKIDWKFQDNQNDHYQASDHMLCFIALIINVLALNAVLECFNRK